MLYYSNLCIYILHSVKLNLNLNLDVYRHVLYVIDKLLAADLYLIYKLESKASVCMSNKDHTWKFYLAYQIDCSGLSTILKIISWFRKENRNENWCNCKSTNLQTWLNIHFFWIFHECLMNLISNSSSTEFLKFLTSLFVFRNHKMNTFECLKLLNS